MALFRPVVVYSSGDYEICIVNLDRRPLQTPTGHSKRPDAGRPASALRRYGPVAAIVLVAVLVFAMGWHRELTLENLVRHRATLNEFVNHYGLGAIAAFVGLYIGVVALSLPGATLLTLTGGILFGTLVGGLSAIVGATIGATVIFLVARSAAGEALVRSAGPKVTRLADGFRENAFSYLLFLRFVPIFPFFLVNLAAAVFRVPLSTFVVTTLIGIVPATFAFALAGRGLDSAIAAQQESFSACEAAGRADCKLAFDIQAAITPQLLAAFAALGVVALIPVVVSRWRARQRDA